MRRLLLCVALLGCSDGPSGPVTIPGRWSLATVAGNRLPQEIDAGAICSHVASGYIDLRADGSFDSKIAFGPAPHCSVEWVNQGTYATDGASAMRFTMSGVEGGQVVTSSYDVAFDGRSMTRTINGHAYVWQK